MVRKKKTLAIILVIASFHTLAQNVKTVVNKYFESVGGKEFIESIKTASSSYHSFGYYPKRDTSRTQTKQKLPFHEISVTYDTRGKLEYQSVFTEDSMQMLWMNPYLETDSKRTTKRSVAVDPATELLALYNSKSLRYSKTDTLKGMVCQILKAYSDKQAASLFYFDNETGLLLARRTNDNITFFKAYEKVSGLYFPFLREQYLHGMLLDKVVYDTILLNVDLDINDFKIQATTNSTLRKRNSKYNHVEFVDAKYSNSNFKDLTNSFLGKRILIDLWATWCVPCKMEFTKYDDGFYEFLAKLNINVLFISLDKPEREKAWKKDLLKFNLNGYQLRADKKLHSSIQEEIGHNKTFYIPRYVLIDENGVVLSDDLGKPSFLDFREKVTTLLKSPRTIGKK